MVERQQKTTAVITTGICLVFAVGGVFADEVKKDVFVAPKLPEGEYVPIATDESSTEKGVVLVRENPEIEGLKKEIQERENKIIKTEREIENINKELGQIYEKKSTLEGELKGLNLTNRRNEAQIQVTEENIYKGQLPAQNSGQLNRR